MELTGLSVTGTASEGAGVDNVTDGFSVGDFVTRGGDDGLITKGGVGELVTKGGVVGLPSGG